MSVLYGTVARADSVDVETQSLDNLAFYVEQLDRGYDPLIERFETKLAELRASADEAALVPLRERRDEVTTKRIDQLLADASPSDEETVLEYCRLLIRDGVAEETKTAARDGLAGVSVNKGNRERSAGNVEAAFAAYEEALETVPGFEAAVEGYGELGLELVEERVEAHEYKQAIEKLDGLIEFLPAGHSRTQEAESRRERIFATTGEVRVRLVGDAARLGAVRGPQGKKGTSFESARILLEPTGDDGVALEVSAAGKTRLLRGSYRATVTGVGDDPDAVPVIATVDVGAGIAEIVAPRIVPYGMVYVEGGSIDGGPRIPSFLCDRTEVRNDYYAEFAGETGRAVPYPAAATLPVRGVTHSDALEFATKWAKKSLPTRRQWTYAALGKPGGGRRPYSWGQSSSPRPGVDFFGAESRTEPGRADGCAEGASAFQIRNMFRNVWEWLDDGWFIGGGFTGDSHQFDIPYEQKDANWSLRVLEDPLPSKRVFDEFQDPEQVDKYSLLVKDGQFESFLPEIGFRCVMTLE